MKKEIIKKYSDLGKIGGKALVKKIGKEGMANLGKKGMASRWKNHKKDLSTGK